MRRTLAVLMMAWCLLQNVACSLWPEHAQVDQFSQATGGGALERSFWESVHQKDWKELDKHLASNYVAITPRGRFERNDALQQLKNIDVQSYSLSNMITTLNTDTIVVSGEIVLRGSIGGQPLPDSPTHLMAVWQRQKAGWILLAHSLEFPARS